MVIKPRASWLVKVYLISYHYKAFSHDVIAAMHIGVPKQWNCSHVGVSNQSCESWTLFVCTTLSLCSNKFAHVDAGHVSKNALQYKGKMLTLSTELTSDCSLRKKLTPLHFLHAGANSPRACPDFLKRRSRIISDCLAFGLGSVTSHCSEIWANAPPPNRRLDRGMSLLLSNLTWTWTLFNSLHVIS